MSKSYWYVKRVKYFMGDFQKNRNFMHFSIQQKTGKGIKEQQEIIE